METKEAKSSPLENVIYDVAVIGGGPAGMMAAGRAAELLAAEAKIKGETSGTSNTPHVILIEKNDKLGKKLLITGGGRCNVTNAEFDDRKLLEKFKDNGKFLFSAFSQWSVKETFDFFHLHQMQTKVEKELRAFPLSNTAQSVWDVLVEYIDKNGVKVLSKSPVIEIITNLVDDANQESGQGKIVTGVRLKNKKIIRARNVIIATGGTSRPETGSTGDGYAWLRKLGHTVIDPTPSLVPIALKDTWVERLSGVVLTDIKLTTFQNGVKQDSQKGKLLFTHVGISGPTILNMSKDVGELLKYGDVTIELDLLPQFDYSTGNDRLLQLFREENNNKLFKNSLQGLIPAAMAPVIVELSGIEPEMECNSITREERISLLKLLKGVPLHVDHLLGIEKAIITSGGVSLEEVDFKTMRSKLFPNLYLVGDILNIDRPSGGYSLQLCWTTGFVAGNAVGSP